MSGMEFPCSTDINDSVVFDRQTTVVNDPPGAVDCYDRPVKQQEPIHSLSPYLSVSVHVSCLESCFMVLMF
jgi:hypothetical protein